MTLALRFAHSSELNDFPVKIEVSGGPDEGMRDTSLMNADSPHEEVIKVKIRTLEP